MLLPSLFRTYVSSSSLLSTCGCMRTRAPGPLQLHRRQSSFICGLLARWHLILLWVTTLYMSLSLFAALECPGYVTLLHYTYIGNPSLWCFVSWAAVCLRRQTCTCQHPSLFGGARSRNLVATLAS